MDFQAQPENVAGADAAPVAVEAATVLPWNMGFQAWTGRADSAEVAAAVAAAAVARQIDLEHQRNIEDENQLLAATRLDFYESIAQGYFARN